MAFWLLKSEPESYPIERFAKDKSTLWTGVRNYQARNLMVNDMKKGDLFFFYHSNSTPTGIFGLGEIIKVGCVDPTQFDRKDPAYEERATKENPVWRCCEVRHLETWIRPVTLADIKARAAEFKALPLLAKGQRLSVQPVADQHASLLLKLGRS
jgi:predicted RNA-binding protein with PUA-like domain